MSNTAIFPFNRNLGYRSYTSLSRTLCGSGLIHGVHDALLSFVPHIPGGKQAALPRNRQMYGVLCTSDVLLSVLHNPCVIK